MGQDCSQTEGPSTAHVLLGPLGQIHWSPYGQMGGAVHRESPHITVPLWSLGALAICLQVTGGVWAAAGAARPGALMGIFHIPTSNPA